MHSLLFTYFDSSESGSNMFGRSVSGVLGSSGLSRTQCKYRTVVCSLHPRSSERSTLWHPEASASQPCIRCHNLQRTGFAIECQTWPCRFRDPRALWHSIGPPSPPDRYSTDENLAENWYFYSKPVQKTDIKTQSIFNHSINYSSLSWCSLAIRQHNCASLRTVQLTPLDSSSMLASPSGIAWLERWNVGFWHSTN